MTPMTPEEVLNRAACFDPTAVDPARVMRLALQMIVVQCNGYTGAAARVADPMRRVAKKALEDCGISPQVVENNTDLRDNGKVFGSQYGSSHADPLSTTGEGVASNA